MEHSRLIEKIQSTAGYRTITVSNKGSNKSTTNTTATQSTTKSPPLVVADMMAGVGPFAVPLAMPLYSNNTTKTIRERDIIVHANGKNMGFILVFSLFSWVSLIILYVYVGFIGFSHYLCGFYRVFCSLGRYLYVYAMYILYIM